jgi:O-antigen/teichoic acid export membrane protein
MTEQQSSYRQIIKATSLFGGVQVFQIIIQVIRSKFIAVLLGPSGMGIAGLLSSTIGFISSLTSFGLGTSAVKDIAGAAVTSDQIRIATVVTVLRRLAWLTGSLGVVITLVMSSWLSQITFGNHNYTIAFVWISITLLFNQLSNSKLVILQGMRRLKYLAKANLAGSVLGLLVTVPLYYLFGINGIVPGIIATAIITLALSWYYSEKVQIESLKIDRHQTLAVGKTMLLMGLMISISGLFSQGASYLVRIYIRIYGGIDEVGLYNAGFTIINTYVGLVFTAMATDYYPRLSAVANDNHQCKNTINQQAEISLLILAPILLVFLVFIKLIVILLYSSKFIAVNEMICWAALGMIYKAASWSISFILLAKGTSKIFFWNELISNIYLLGFSITGYHFFGLEGLGISFLATYIFYLVQVYILSKIKFEFSFDHVFIRIFIIQNILVISGLIVVKHINFPYSYIIGTIMIVVSSWYSFTELNKRIGIKTLLVSAAKILTNR